MMSAAHLRRHRVTVPTQLRSYTPDETAIETGLTLDELRRMRENGQGPAYVTIGKRTVRYLRSDVDEWKAAQRSRMSIHS
jgi:predicted DNA-binding transcriptional regulator AlpA